MSNVILVSSQKRDIGKTIIGIKISVELSKGGKTLLIDLSSGKTKISDYFRVSEDIIYDVKDVLDETCSVEQAIIDIQDNLSILPYPRIANKIDIIKKDDFTKLISQVNNNYDSIVLDIDSLLFCCNYLNFDLITNALIVNNNDFSSINEINNEILTAEKFNIKSNVVINRFNKNNASKGSMLRLKDLKSMLIKEYIGIIEEDKKYFDLEYDIIFNKTENTFNKNILKIANCLKI